VSLKSASHHLTSTGLKQTEFGRLHIGLNSVAIIVVFVVVLLLVVVAAILCFNPAKIWFK
jgi:hypothetical protein